MFSRIRASPAQARLGLLASTADPSFGPIRLGTTEMCALPELLCVTLAQSMTFTHACLSLHRIMLPVLAGTRTTSCLIIKLRI